MMVKGMRFFRASLLAGLVVAAFLFLPPVVQTTNAATCNCSNASTSDESSCTACVTHCSGLSSGVTMSSYNGSAGTACLASGDVDPASAPASGSTITGTPETPAAVGAADDAYCTSASGLDQVKCQLLLLIAEILNTVASFLGKILVILVDILISFASYNGFGSAIVVQRGWVVVRDVVNMFFIVVLLISAFATIIGYDTHSFHYKNVLPKLLLMAVLINFSRTLIQLLIDFSQVIMLTFVNAFASAGPGNLVSALKLDQVLRMAPPTGTGGDLSQVASVTGTVDPINIILALMLAVFMLSVSLGVVVIMTAYLIFRIVGIWVALILSPIALFTTALPGRLQKGVDQFSGKYWTRLSALLTGGPVMAFFLWLTFAITQSSAGVGGLAQAVNIQTNNPTVAFLTSIGNSQDIASFIVGVTLMLMGLDAAIGAADNISHTLGNYAKKVGGASTALGRLAAASPLLAGYYLGARPAAQAIGAGANALNRRTNITGTLAGAALPLANRIPIIGQAVRPGLIKATKAVSKQNTGIAEENIASMEGMKTKDKIALLQQEMGRAATDTEKNRYGKELMQLAGEKGANELKQGLMEDATTQMRAARLADLQRSGLNYADAVKRVDSSEEKDLIKNRAGQLADRQVAARQAELLQAARGAADKAKDTDTVRTIDEQFKKNPQLSSDMAGLAKKLVADPNSIKKLSDQAKNDMGLNLAMLQAAGALKVDNSGNIAPDVDSARFDAFIGKVTDKDSKENMEMLAKLVKDSNAGSFTTRNVGQMVMGRDEKNRKRIMSLPTKEAPST
ncbi:MAG TPA: hypothetical protein VMU11_03335, partial [Verrucomicrobiae bacterium]|nr:hypothetical protein [Verrucomicrobiae bacterium]